MFKIDEYSELYEVDRLNDDEILELLWIAKLKTEGMSNERIKERIGSHEDKNKIAGKVNKNPFLTKIRFSAEKLPHQKQKRLLKQLDLKLGKGTVRDDLSDLSLHKMEIPIDICSSNDIADYQGKNNRCFGKGVAEVLDKLFSRCSTVGIAWDAQICPPFTINPDFPLSKKVKPNFMPVCGVKNTEESTLRYSSTTISERFNYLIHGENAKEVRNMNCIPLAHPNLHEDGATESGSPESEEIEKYFSKVWPQYNEIFGVNDKGNSEVALIDSIDMILTSLSVSNADNPGATMEYLYPENGKFRVKNLKEEFDDYSSKDVREKISVGEMAGVLLPNMDEKKNSKLNIKICKQLNERLATLRPEHFKECARRSAISTDNIRPPGVVVIAKGPERAKPILRAITEGYISRLIIDMSLYKALEEELSKIQLPH